MIGFLILHYKAIAPTRECVASIRALAGGESYPILIVDNGSDNGTYEALLHDYAGQPNITVLTTGKNLGFSGGNNYGAAHFPARETLDALVVCNSDIVFVQQDFCALLKSLCAACDFDVLGPDIYKKSSGETISTSPLYRGMAAPANVKRYIKVFNCRIAALESGRAATRQATKRLYPSLGTALGHLCFCAKKARYDRTIRHSSRPVDNAILQGACVIFSRKYLAGHTALFTPETFLYDEESILYARAQREGLKLCYRPELRVWHKEAASTGTDLTRDEAAYYLRYLRNRVHSLEILAAYQSGRTAEGGDTE